MPDIFDYIGDTLAMKAELLYGELALISYDNYKWKCRTGEIKKIVRGGRGRQAWVEYASLERCGLARLVEAALGFKPREVYAYNPLKSVLEIDYKAADWFADYRYGDEGNMSLPPEVQAEYTHNASVLNAVWKVANARRAMRSRMAGGKGIGTILAGLYADVQRLDPRVWKHSLNYANARSFERVCKAYKEEGYSSLVHKNYGNKSALKVNEAIERVLMGIFCMDNKPYGSGVLDIYLMFLAGKQRLLDAETGEILNPADCCDEDGNPILITAATVNNWLRRKWDNLNVADKKRNSELYWAVKHRPMAMRHAPNYSLSKLTMDDIAIPFKRPDGSRVWAYQIFDTQSTAVVGRAYAADKETNLLVEALKDFMYLCVANGWGVPGQIECEQHLANTMTGKETDDGQFEADLLTAGVLFSHVTFCRGGWPVSKRAEGFIKQKKYKHQNKRPGFLRRPFARLEANLLNTDKSPKRYTLKEIIANEEADINDYNNSLHPDQDQYPGMTRWQVLIENINPALPQPQLPILAYHIGECRQECKIHNSQWVEVAGQRWQLPSPAVMRQLTGTTVQAYWFPIGDVGEIYLYQNKRYVCTCKPVERFNEAVVERTDDDERIMTDQFKYTAQFMKMTKDYSALIPKIKLLPAEAAATGMDGKTSSTPIHGEYNEPDLVGIEAETEKAGRKAERKAQRETEKEKERIRKLHMEYIDANVNLADYD
jgi:hypothetical protein